MAIQTINPAVFGPPMFPYSQGATGTGTPVYLAGQVGMGNDNVVVAPGDAYEQSKVLIERMSITLAEVGGTLQDIASATVFLTALEHTTGFNKAWIEAFGDHRPARASVIADLLVEGAVVEVQAIALVPQPDQQA